MLIHDKHLMSNYKKEKGFSQTLKIDNGKLIDFWLILYLEWFEMVIHDL